VHDVRDAAAGTVHEPADIGPSLAQRVADVEARLAVLEDALGMSTGTSASVAADRCTSNSTAD
jgi:hypothetical protein